MKKLIILIFILFSGISFSQEMIQGKLLLEDFSTIKISVFNKNSKEIIETDSRGIFKMKMNESDTLVFYQDDLIFDALIIPKHVIETKSLRYFLKKEGSILEELIIDKTPLFNLGGKKLTRAEKLEHQNSIKLVQNNSLGVTTDGIVNRISGRNNIIKKIKKFETNERDFKEFMFIYTDKKLLNEFKIPKEYINLFVYYIIDDPEFDHAKVSLNEEYHFFLIQKTETFKKEFNLNF